MSNPTNEQELRAEVKQILKDGFNYYIGERKDTSSDMKPLDIYCTEHLMQRLTAHTNAEIARTLDRLEAEFDRHAQSIGLWGMEGLVLDTLARTGNLSSEQKVERDAMVTERRALAVLHGAIQAERAKLKEVK